METEKIVLASLQYQNGPDDIAESLVELERLAWTAGGQVVFKRILTRPRPDAALFFGPGQVEDLKTSSAQAQAALLIVDHELKPIQARNLEKAMGIRVIDRTQLILDIFARRARTHEGKLQVEMAQLSYLLPRLTGKGIELSRLGGGIGTRGPGETKLEDDRRRLRTRMAVLKRQLETMKQTRALHRQDREAIPLPLVSLVGYTNAGKSALLRALTGQKALVEDKLFATLDLATRKMILPPSQEVLLTDTVGFIRRLPHHLVAAFRGTLEEVVSADLLLHVIDCSHPHWETQVATVNQVLSDLGAAQQALIMVFNKVDQVSRAMRHRLAHQYEGSVRVSALTGEGLDDLRQAIKARLGQTWERITLRLAYDEADLRALVLRRGRVLRETYGPKFITLQAEVPPMILGKIQSWRQTRKNQRARNHESGL